MKKFYHGIIEFWVLQFKQTFDIEVAIGIQRFGVRMMGYGNALGQTASIFRLPSVGIGKSLFTERKYSNRTSL